MRCVFFRVFLFLLVWAAQAGPAAGAARAPVSQWIGGWEYIRLADWARSHGFVMRWIKRDESLELSDSVFRIFLQIHSPEAQINQVQVRLLLSLAQQGDTVWISRADTSMTFDPVLSHPRLERGVALRTICIDPGHGGKDPGNQVGSNQEKKLALLLAEELQTQLKRCGWKVSLTRTRDTFVELPDRPDIARRRRADLFISIHLNAAGTSARTVKGAEVYCLTPAGVPSTNAGGEGGGEGRYAGNRFNDENMFLAYELQKALTHQAGAEDRGVHRARFWVLREAPMPAALVEVGFLSHPIEGRQLCTAGYRRELAGAIVAGINAYKRAVERGA